MNRIRRRWRSVTFRSGLGAALVVGTITSLGLLILALVLFATFIFSSLAVQETLTERLQTQVEFGVAPADLDVNSPSIEFLLEDGFWVVFEGDEIAASGGLFDQAVLDASYTDTNGLQEDFGKNADQAGTKVVDGDEWFVMEDTIERDGSSFTIVTGSVGDFVFRRFLSVGLPFLIPIVLVVMLVAGMVSSLFTRLALRSVEKIRVEVDHITQESLDRRVPLTGSGDRIDKLATTMNSMLERLEDSTDQQNQFLADASHELRSPVAGLVAQLDVAASYPDRVDATTLLPKLQRESHRLQLVVEDLLFLSRAAAQDPGELPPPGRVAIEELLAAEVTHQLTLAPDAHIDRVGRAAESIVIGNERDLIRAIRNVLDNAVRHCDQAVTVGVVEQAHEVLITIADDGEGIAPEDAERIFDRFVRLDESRHRDAGGSGLGLAIVDQIVRAHGGTITVDSSPTDQRGTTFMIRLPVAG